MAATKYICISDTIAKGRFYSRGDVESGDVIGERAENDPCWKKNNNFTMSEIKQQIPEAIKVAKGTADRKHKVNMEQIIDKTED